jgi:branched-chain amino acid transport system substrate-binding protein
MREQKMLKKYVKKAMGCAVVVPLVIGTASAADLKIGLLVTVSGSAAANGEQARDGFLLGVEKLGGKLGGVDTEIVIVDDEGKPDLAASKATELVTTGKVDIVVGPIFSSVFTAIAKPVTDAGAFIISPNAGPSIFAGKDCNPNIFVASYQNDQPHEVLGAYAQKLGYKRVFVLTANYQAGKDAIAGFKHSFRGDVLGEIYVPLGQLDFASELAQIALEQPDAVYTFMPGGMGVNLVKQFAQAGLSSIPFLSAFTVDEGTLPAQQDAALGMKVGTTWAPNFDLPASKEFVAAFEKKYNYIPATYAMQGYDVASIIDAAVRQAGGDVSDRDKLRAAIESAKFDSLRGNFRFGKNHYPIQDFYLAEAVKRADGKYQTSIVEKIFSEYEDNYASKCVMKK